MNRFASALIVTVLFATGCKGNSKEAGDKPAASKKEPAANTPGKPAVAPIPRVRGSMGVDDNGDPVEVVDSTGGGVGDPVEDVNSTGGGVGTPKHDKTGAVGAGCTGDEWCDDGLICEPESKRCSKPIVTVDSTGAGL